MIQFEALVTTAKTCVSDSIRDFLKNDTDNMRQITEAYAAIKKSMGKLVKKLNKIAVREKAAKIANLTEDWRVRKADLVNMLAEEEEKFSKELSKAQAL